MGALRVLLAICVLFQHCGPLGNLNWVLGTTAVEMFFVISGFYMQMVLQERYTPQRLGRGYIAKFYAARYSRLFPAYCMCLILTVLAAVAYGAAKDKPAPLIESWLAIKNLQPNLENLALWCWALIANATMGLQDLALVLAVNDGVAHFSVDRQASEIYVMSSLAITQAWSLGVELVFYAVAPFLVRLRSATLLWIFIVALGVKCLGIFAAELQDLPYRTLPFVMVDFLAGMLAYRYRAQLASRWLLGQRFGPAVAYLIVALLVAAFPVTGGPASLMMVGLTMLVLPTVFEATRRYSLDNAIGELSYPFYLFHLLVYDSLTFVFKAANVYETQPQALIATALIATLAVSYAVNKLELTSIEPWRRRLSAGSAA